MSTRTGRPIRSSRGGAGYSRGRGGQGSSVKLNGLFDKGQWFCNCSPRLPAENFAVKKEGPNKGRRFFTCQNQQAKRCGFFLWSEDAQPREAAAVLNNSRSEPVDAAVQEGWNAGRETPAKARFAAMPQYDLPLSPSPTLLTSHGAMKRDLQEAGFANSDDDEDEFFSLTGKEEEELVKAADHATFETPHKAQKIGVYATPATTEKRTARKLPWLQDPTTPASSKKTVSDYFSSTPSKSSSNPGFVAELPATPVPVAHSSTASAPGPQSPSPPTRHKDALVNPADRECALTNEVLAELAQTRLPPQTMANLRSILSKHDLRTQGVTKGRDISRLALKAKEAKVTELQAKVNSLQAELELDRGLIARLKWQKENGREEEETDDEL